VKRVLVWAVRLVEMLGVDLVALMVAKTVDTTAASKAVWSVVVKASCLAGSKVDGWAASMAAKTVDARAASKVVWWVVVTVVYSEVLKVGC